MPLRKNLNLIARSPNRAFGILVFFLGFLAFGNRSEGSTLCGSEMSYQALGNNHYIIHYFLYTDASSSAPGQYSPLEIRSASCNYYSNSILTLDPRAVETINGDCPSNAPSAQAYKKWLYTCEVILPFPCDDWKLSASECCRSGAISSIQIPTQTALFTEVLINNTIGQYSSPSFANNPVFAVNTGQFNRGEIQLESNGLDSVSINSIAPAQTTGINVNYKNGYSPTNPITLITPMNLDEKTGNYCLFPLVSETGILAFKVNGYKNGRIVTSIYREHTISSITSTNHTPQLSGFNGSGNYDLSICGVSRLNFNLNSSDADLGSIVQLTLLDTLPGAHISKSDNSGRPQLTIDWTPLMTIGTTWYQFNVRVSDNDCPINNAQVFTYRIKVSNWDVHVMTTPVSCFGVSNGSAQLTLSGNDSPVAISWSNGQQNTFGVNNLDTGYQYVIMSQANGCSIREDFNITGHEGISPVSVEVQLVNCQGGHDGQAAVILPMPTDNYSIQWSTGEQFNFISGVESGNRTVTIRDNNTGCIINKNVSIGYNHPLPEINMDDVRSACSGKSVLLETNTVYSNLVWQNGSTTPSINVTESGNYHVTVTDEFGCTATAGTRVEFYNCNDLPSLSLMPNPASDKFIITFGGQEFTTDFWDILDLSGRLVLSGGQSFSGNMMKVDIGGLSKGVYLLHLSIDGKWFSTKFIKS